MKGKDNSIDIKVRDSIFEVGSIESKDQRKAYKKNISSGNKPLYKVWIYLEGDDLPFVKRVKYVLHSTFRDPIHIIERTTINQNCAMAFWTWGIFEVKVELEDIRGRVMMIRHKLQYYRQLKNKNVLWIKN